MYECSQICIFRIMCFILPPLHSVKLLHVHIYMFLSVHLALVRKAINFILMPVRHFVISQSRLCLCWCGTYLLSVTHCLMPKFCLVIFLILGHVGDPLCFFLSFVSLVLHLHADVECYIVWTVHWHKLVPINTEYAN